MNIAMIGCPFRTSYGAYIKSLSAAIGRRTGSKVEWIGSNCGCDDPVERSRSFESSDIDYFELPIIGESASAHPLKRWLRNSANDLDCSIRARRFMGRHGAAQVVHFQQVLNAYGSNVAFRWLQQPATAARFVTVHELDAYQIAHRQANSIYNRADGVLVHAQELKERMTELGVRADLIHVVRHGVDIPSQPVEQARQDLIFYGGHKLMTGKGLDILFEAMSMVVKEFGSAAPRLKIHGHYGTTVPGEALALAQSYGVADRIDWLNQISVEEICDAYQRALMCLLPYAGSFAGLPAAIAAAHGLPVVATRKAGIPEHLGELAFWIDERNPQQLADTIALLLRRPDLRAERGAALRLHAKNVLGWDVIAKQTVDIYEQALASRSGTPRQVPLRSPEAADAAVER
ncbi:MAG: glycosyltransferase family 4 protein [Rhodocyclaceae bacterium]|nr:glycosyltransferase family 4 protein [Rhodocyclaceae bacterium]